MSSRKHNRLDTLDDYEPTSPANYAPNSPPSMEYSAVLNQYGKSNTASHKTGKSSSSHRGQHSGNPQVNDRIISSRSASPQIKRIRLSHDDLAKLSKEQLATKWLQQDSFLDALESNLDDVTRQSEQLRHSLDTCELRYKRKQLETARRENSLHMKLSIKEKRLQQLQDQLDNINKVQLPTPHQLESTLIDPAVNLMFEKMKYEVETAKTRAEEMQNELSAWKFTPDSNTGKRLMAKCRLLHNENEELGKDISSGWVAQLTGNLALQKKFSEEMKKSQSELDEFLLELEEEVEGMQNTIYYLQQQLKEARVGEKKHNEGSITMQLETNTDINENNMDILSIQSTSIKEENSSMATDQLSTTIVVKKEAADESPDDNSIVQE